MIKYYLGKVVGFLIRMAYRLWEVFVWCFSSIKKKYSSLKQEENAVKKFKVVKVLVIVVMAFLIVYYAYLIFLQGPKYKEEVYDRQNREFTQAATRGNIYDTNGKVLAATVESYTVCVSKKEVEDYGTNKYREGDVEDYRRLVATNLSAFLGLEYEDVLEKLKSEGNYWNIAVDIDVETGDKIKEWINKENIKGVTVENDTARYYPYGSLAAHVIGFTGTDDHGLALGVELELDDVLSGTDGKIRATVEKNGNAIPGYDTLTLAEKVDGYNVNLTIDVNIQKIAEDVLNRATYEFGAIEGGCVIVMDAKNADVLAMASNPTFDLNNPREFYGLSKDSYFWREGSEYDEKKALGTLTEEELENPPSIISSFVWRNKALASTYEPGSTFKSITAAIALEEGVVSPSTPVLDDDLEIAGWTIHCSTSDQEGGHGTELFRYGVANSCNPVMARVALRVGVDKYYSYVKAFGFKNKTNILLSGEAVGVIHQNPTEIDLAVTSFGQRFTITPIQLATAYCAIANGGTLYEPRLVKNLTDASGNVVKTYDSKEVREVISDATSKTVMELLEGVVSEGTGANAYVAGFRIAGKTGTAETATSETDGRYFVSFCAVAPSDNPEIVVLAMLDHPTIGEAAGAKMGTRMAAEIVKQTLIYKGVNRVYKTDDNKKIKNVYYVNDVVGLTVLDAISTIKVQSGRMHNVVVIGNGENVISQYPEANELICREGTIVLYTENIQESTEDYVKMPNVIGMTLGEAHAAITDIGLNVYAVQEGKVVTQSIEPGTAVPRGTIVKLSLREGE